MCVHCAVRYFALFLAVSAFVLAVAAVASNDWANSFDVTTSTRVTKFGLFNKCHTVVNDGDNKRFEFCCQSTCLPRVHPPALWSTRRVVFVCWCWC